MSNISTSINTSRLRLTPCPYAIAEAAIKENPDYHRFADTKFSNDWPSDDTKGILSTYMNQVQQHGSEFVWGVWLIILSTENRVIGDLGFKAEPSEDGIVEIGYNVVPSYRNQGFGFESVKALTDWVLKQQIVKKVIAQCDKDNQYSIRILKKIGARVKTCGDGVLTWEISR